jgi:hypothetical protein
MSSVISLRLEHVNFDLWVHSRNKQAFGVWGAQRLRIRPITDLHLDSRPPVSRAKGQDPQTQGIDDEMRYGRCSLAVAVRYVRTADSERARLVSEGFCSPE